MTAWTPDPVVPKAWSPGPQASLLVPVDSYFVILLTAKPAISTDAGDPYSIVDLVDNVRGGRKPYTFALGASTFPAATFLEPNGRLALPFLGILPGSNFIASVDVWDANRQHTSFTIASKDQGTGPLTLSGLTAGRIPSAHFGVPFQWQLLSTGGIAPVSFRFQGLNLAQYGFAFDPSTGILSGAYSDVTTRNDNVILLAGYNAGTPYGGVGDATIGALWSMINP